MTRMATVKRFPGEQYISPEAARLLIKRGTYPARVTDQSDEHFFDEPSDTEEVRFRHDPKLTLPSYTYNTHEQVRLRCTIYSYSPPPLIERHGFFLCRRFIPSLIASLHPRYTYLEVT